MIRLPRKFIVGISKEILRKRCKHNIKSEPALEREWRSVVGLEIHAQIPTKSKLFSSAPTNFDSPPNENVSYFDASLPGTLPVVNEKCVEAAIRTGLALDCKINPISVFDRKHYFYADLPAGYQITQQRLPIAVNGIVHFKVFKPGKKPYICSSKIKQIQLEQDSGRSYHDPVNKRSLIDLNRAGVPLMEFVFEPDLTDGEEAAALVKELVLILETLNTCTGKMEEGALRVDANISVENGTIFGPRTEVKNIGSIRGVSNAVKSEIQRQMKIVKSGGSVISETRAYDAEGKSTVPMRFKEERHDYRFMPEPNLLPLHIELCKETDKLSVPVLNKTIPELPETKREYLRKNYNLSLETSHALVDEIALLELFTNVMEINKGDPRLISNIILQELLGALHKNKLSIKNNNVSAEQLADLTNLLENGDINLQVAKDVLQEIIQTNNKEMPQNIVQRKGLIVIKNEDQLTKLCQDVLNENQKMVEDYRKGNKKILGAFMGIIAKKTNKQADMAKVAKIMQNLLSK